MSMIAIISTLALPAFTTMIQKNNQSAQSNNFISALLIARSEAVKRGQRAVICSSKDGATCDAGVDWEAGWLIYIDENANNALDTSESLIQIGAAMKTGYTLIGTASIKNQVRYKSNGSSLETGTLTLCDPRGADHAEAIIISASGKPKTSDTAAGGGALTCS